VSHYNGIYDVVSFSGSSPFVLTIIQRSDDFNDFNEIHSSFIYVKSPLEGGKATTTTGSSWLVKSPLSTDTGFVLDTSNVDFQSVHETGYGTMAKQDANNVNISGGGIQVGYIKTNCIEPTTDSNVVSVHLPDNTVNSRFNVKSYNFESDKYEDVFTVDGEGTTTAFNFNSLSDASLKTDVQDIQNPLELVKKLSGKTFLWTDDQKNQTLGGRSYGFIAQEVGAEFPSLVSETLDGYLSVDYSKTVSILVEAVKDLITHIENVGYTFPSDTTTTNNTSNNGLTININNNEIEGNTTTNILSVGLNVFPITIDIASTPNDSITVTPLLGNSYLINNQGLNTLDSTNVLENDIILIKDAIEPRYNGIYEVGSIQIGQNNTQFSICSRHPYFDTIGNIAHSHVCIKENGGSVNGGKGFLCIDPYDSNDTGFVLDTSNIIFGSFGQSEIGTMAYQNADNVNITGGNIEVPSINVSEIRPHNTIDSNEVSVCLKTQTENDLFKVTAEGSTATLFTVDGKGNAYARDFTTPSDQTLKTDIQDITSAVELVKKFRGVTYNWKESTYNHPTGNPYYGFIAQEVNAHFPSLVYKRYDDKLTVDYSKVVSILVEAVKDIAQSLSL
jgi:hypothetical protein